MNLDTYESLFAKKKGLCDCIKVGRREGKKPANVVNSVGTQIFITGKD